MFNRKNQQKAVNNTTEVDKELDDADLMAVNGGVDYFDVKKYSVQIDAAVKAGAEYEARTQYDIDTGVIQIIPKGLTDFLASQT